MNIYTKDPIRYAIEEATAGKMTVIKDAYGMHHIFYILTRQIMSGTTHEAFIIDGKEVPYLFVGAYPLAQYASNRYVTKSGLTPKTSISFAEAQSACQAMGNNWHLLTKWEHAAIISESTVTELKRVDSITTGGSTRTPSGALLRGSQHIDVIKPGLSSIMEQGTVTTADMTCLNGSMGAIESHLLQSYGVFGLGGNIKEWVSGIIIRDNRIYFADDNDYTLATDNTDLTGVDYIKDVSGNLKITSDANVATGGTTEFGYIPNADSNDMGSIDAKTARIGMCKEYGPAGGLTAITEMASVGGSGVGIAGDCIGYEAQDSTNYNLIVGAKNMYSAFNTAGFASWEQITAVPQATTGFRVVIAP